MHLKSIVIVNDSSIHFILIFDLVIFNKCCNYLLSDMQDFLII